MGNCGKFRNFSTRDTRIVEKKGEDKIKESKAVVNLKIEWLEDLPMTVK